MRSRASLCHVAASVVVSLAVSTVAMAQGGPPPTPPAITAKDRAAIVEDLLKGLNETYVFPEVAEKMSQNVRQRLATGAYDGLGSLREFCDALTEDMQSISHDKHLGVRWRPRPAGESERQPTPAERRARELAAMQRENFCFEKLERLPGNIGYLKFNCFASAELAGATAIAAMNFLGHTDALIFDLRDNGGGDPSMIQLLTSYLFEESKHLNSFYIRKSGATNQFWSHAYVPGPRLPDAPVFVLTSSRTFSGAEEFSYNLKSMKRGTIIGETTGGGAHPVDAYTIDGYDVVAMLPFGRAVNPITGTNWEGTGVAPDIEVPAAAALDTARVKALEALEAKAEDEAAKGSLAWVREGLQAQVEPFAIAEAGLRAFVGAYGPRRITLEDGSLFYQRDGRPKYRLVAMGDALFTVPDLAFFRIGFERGPDGKVARIVGLYDNGQRDANERTK